MKVPVGYALLVALIAPVAVTRAEQPFDPADRAAAIAPFIDELTVAVAYLDLARIAIDPILDKLVEIVPEAQYDVDQDRAQLDRLHAALLDAGANELYVVVSLADLPRSPPFGIVPNAEYHSLDRGPAAG